MTEEEKEIRELLKTKDQMSRIRLLAKAHKILIAAIYITLILVFITLFFFEDYLKLNDSLLILFIIIDWLVLTLMNRYVISTSAWTILTLNKDLEEANKKLAEKDNLS